MDYLDKEYSNSDLNNLKQKAKNYCELKDSQYSFFNKKFNRVSEDNNYSAYSKFLGRAAKSVGRGVMNTASSGGKLLGSKRLGGWARNAMVSRSQRKIADGASGIIAKKAGLDKKDVSNVINHAGRLTGATTNLRDSIVSGKANKVVGDTAKRAKAYGGDLKQKAAEYAKQAQERMQNLRSNSTGPTVTTT